MNIDIAPTILDMAGIEQPIHMDGRSLMPLIQSYCIFNDFILNK